MKTPFKALNVTLCLSLKTLFIISIFYLYGVGLSAQSEIVGSMSIRDSLKIGGSVKIDGSLNIQDSLKIGGSAIIEGTLNIQDSLNIGGSTNIGGSLDVQD
jgi:UDP-3-O-[3-hydroxymyristoyl] glucosamine N-acyltransferase